MRAQPGDRIILAGELVDQPTRAGEVLEVSERTVRRLLERFDGSAQRWRQEFAP